MSEAEKLALARTGLNLLRKWSASDDQARAILAQPSPPAFEAWKRGAVANLTGEQIYRLTMLLQIHATLRARFTSPSQALGWMGRRNATFGGESPLELIAGGQLAEIERVLRYLAADMSPW